MAEERDMITMEARIRNPASHAVLEALLAFNGRQHRRLFRDFYICGKQPNELKREYTKVVTGRHFNSLLSSVQDQIGALEALREEQTKAKEGKIKSARKWIADKTKKIRSLSASIKAVTSYRKKKQQAKVAGKRLRIPSKLRHLSLAKMTAERSRLKSNVHHKQRYLCSLESRLEKLKRESKVSICFGSKKLFAAQFHLDENGYENHAEWVKDFAFARSTYVRFKGSCDETAGNQTAQYDIEHQSLSLRLPKTLAFQGFRDDRIVIEDVVFPEKYLPHLAAAQTPPPLGRPKSHKTCCPVQVKIVKRKKKAGEEVAYYVQVSCAPLQAKVTTCASLGAIGVDLNANHLAIAETDRFGNFIRAESLPFDLRSLSTDQASAVLGDHVAAVVAMAKEAGKPISIEKLDFRAKKSRLREQGAGYAGMLSQFAYDKFRKLMRSRTTSEGVALIEVNPAYSSVIGLYKFYGLNITSHEKAALVLARRALGLSERTKVFHGTRRPPVRMARVEEGPFAAHKPESRPRSRPRHVWSLWARSAKTIRHGLVRGCKKRPKASSAFGERYNRHPQVAKAAGVMSLAEIRRRPQNPPAEAKGSEDAARLTTADLNEQVFAVL